MPRIAEFFEDETARLSMSRLGYLIAIIVCGALVIMHTNADNLEMAVGTYGGLALGGYGVGKLREGKKNVAPQ